MQYPRVIFKFRIFLISLVPLVCMVDTIRYACVPVYTSLRTKFALKVYWQQTKHVGLEFRVCGQPLTKNRKRGWLCLINLSNLLQDLFRFSYLLEYFHHYLMNELYKTHWQTLYIWWSIQCENNHSMTRCLYKSHIHLSYVSENHYWFHVSIHLCTWKQILS